MKIIVYSFSAMVWNILFFLWGEGLFMILEKKGIQCNITSFI